MKVNIVYTIGKVRKSKKYYTYLIDNPLSNYHKIIEKIKEKGYESYGLLALENNLVFIDCDNDETYSYVIENIPQLAKSFTVKTRRGYHIYLNNTSYLPIRSKSIKKNNIALDIKASRQSYVIGVGSVVDGHVYEPIINQPPIDIDQNIYDMLSSLVKTLTKSDIIKPNHRDIVVDFESATIIELEPDKLLCSKKLNLNKLIKDVKKIYKPGNRQNICLYLSAFLIKMGYVNKTHDIIRILSQDDEEHLMRLKAVDYTISKYVKNQEIKGFLGLKELGLNPSAWFYNTNITSTRKNECYKELMAHWSKIINNYCQNKRKITTKDVLQYCLSIGEHHLKNVIEKYKDIKITVKALQMKVAEILKSLGYERLRTHNGNYYINPTIPDTKNHSTYDMPHSADRLSSLSFYFHKSPICQPPFFDYNQLSEYINHIYYHDLPPPFFDYHNHFNSS